MPVPVEGRAREPGAEALECYGSPAPLHPATAQTFNMPAAHIGIVARVSPEHAFAFVIFAAVAAITPGPSNVMLTVTGALVGIARGLPCLFGVGVGMALMMFAMAFGLGTFLLAYPSLVTALKLCGAAFLLWLSWKIASAHHADSVVDQPPVGFLGAFTFQWLNAKSWLVSTSASATYFDPRSNALAQALTIGGLFFIVAVVCGFLWLGFGVVARRMLRSATKQRVFNLTMGVALALSVLLLFS